MMKIVYPLMLIVCFICWSTLSYAQHDMGLSSPLFAFLNGVLMGGMVISLIFQEK